MYVNYAESQRWKIELVSVNENGIGGFKEVQAMISGKGAYSKFKYESGVHRVQRVPETESGGRIHTSTATVAVMPEAEDFDVVIDDKDIRIDVMRASGNGGQCVNTTDSAVRLTHIPTGIVIYSQTEKSQLQNKDKAFRLLRAKLYDLEMERRQNEEADARRSQIGRDSLAQNTVQKQQAAHGGQEGNSPEPDIRASQLVQDRRQRREKHMVIRQRPMNHGIDYPSVNKVFIGIKFIVPGRNREHAP